MGAMNGTADFLRLWWAGYGRPAAFAEGLRGRRAPGWGFRAQLLRAALDALLLYLPLSLLGRMPPTPSYLSFVPTARYYGALVWLTPLVFTAQWLLGGAVIHVGLRLAGRRSDVDTVLNVTGMTTLVVGAFLLLWDWLWLIVGGMDQYALGISHLVIDFWGAVLVVVGLKRLLGVPAWLGAALYVLAVASALPLAVMFMRSPL
jgi:hypothetical protein